MVEDFKTMLMEKPLVSVSMVILGVVIGVFVGRLKFVRKLFKK